MFGWTADEHASFAVLDAFVDGGDNLIDTADEYSALGARATTAASPRRSSASWLAARGAPRPACFIATKVGLEMAGP